MNPRVSRLEEEESERKEQVYKRSQISSVPQDPSVVYGAKTSREDGVQTLLQIGIIPEDDEARRRYKLSHNSFGVGEQSKRNYDWNLDPMSHSFGMKGPEKIEAVSDTLTWPKRDENQSTLKKKSLSESLDLRLPPLNEMTFGAPTHKFDNAAEIMKSWPEDPLKEESKNLVRDDGTAFGVPTIRTDLKPSNKERNSISRQGVRDYGEPKTVIPTNKQRGNVHIVEDWAKSRTKQEVIRIIISEFVEEFVLGIRDCHKRWYKSY